MLSLLFTICMIWFVGKLFAFGLKASWGIMKLLCTVIFFPVILIGMVLGGLMYITLRHGRAPSFCCRGQNGWIYAASERGDGADVTAYVLDGTTLREIARIEIPTGRGLCHLYACGDVIYGSCSSVSFGIISNIPFVN